MDRGRALQHWSLALLGLGFACLLAARILGGVTADSPLRWAPALVPVGWFGISLGLILGAVYAFGRLSGTGRPPPRDPN